MYVACANSNAVTAIETATGKVLETIKTALYPQAPNGSTPNSLALAPDGKVLLAANADNNNLAVIDVSEPGRSKPLGFIPTGWYPTSVRFDTSGEKIYVANGKGEHAQGEPSRAQPIAERAENDNGVYSRPLSGNVFDY